MRYNAGIATLIVLALGASPRCWAQREAKYLVDEEKIVNGADKTPRGWDPYVRLGVNLAMAASNNVVGQTEGTSVTVGAQLDAGTTYLRGPHEWRNKLSLVEAFSRTPSIDEFVKSGDELALQTIYLYHLRRVPWLGPFARLMLNTALLEGRDVRGESVAYEIDGTVRDTATHFKLSDPFQPLRMRETAGAFALPLDKEDVKVECKVGVTASQTFADGVFVVDEEVDPTATAPRTIRLREIETSLQGGPMASLDVIGAIVASRISYFAGVEAMLPVLNDDSQDRAVGDLLNLFIEAGLTVKVFSWASLDYRFRVVREPQVLDEFQIQNNLLLTFSYDFIRSRTEIAKDKEAGAGAS